MWLPNVLRSPSSTPVRRRPPAPRLRLKRLDDRCLPSFIGPVSYPADSIPPGPPAPAQDFNGDGYSDYASLGGPGIITHLGNGDGTFRTGQSLPISGYYSNGLTEGDFNGDGSLDLLATSTTPNDESNSTDYVDVWLGRGDGTFAIRNTNDLGGEPFFRPVVVVDLDVNGRDDVLLGGGYGSLDVWLGQADGTLRLGQHFGSANGDPTVTVAELNTDGIPDLVFSGTDSLGVGLGNGDGTFRSTGAYASGGNKPGHPVAADFDRDGHPDVAVFNGGNPYSDPVVGRSLTVLLGNGDGSFQSPQVLVDGPAAGLRAVADFNSDGYPDVAVAVTGSEVTVMLNAADWPPPPPPSVTISDVTVSEGNSSTRLASFTVSLSKSWGQPVTIAYATANGTATAGSDYQAASGTLTIPAGQTTGTITVLVNGDRLAEATETFVVNLSNATNATIADGQGIGTILDDEPRMSINDVTVREGNTGAVNATFTVSLSAAYDVAVAVHYQTANGSATAGSDYAAASGDVTIAAGQTTKAFTVAVIGDRSAEPNENFVVNLSAATNGSIVDSQGVGTIEDDEPRISIGDVSKKEGKKGQATSFTFTVTLSAAYDQAVTMSFATANGTATTGDGDYVARTGTVTFAAGETTKTITITVNGDGKKEADETFYVDLFGNSSNSLVTKSRGLGTILNDD